MFFPRKKKARKKPKGKAKSDTKEETRRVSMDVPPPVAEDLISNDEGPANKDLRAEAKSLKHMLTHEPFNPYCKACVYGKMCHKQHRRVKPEDKLTTVDFGDLVTGDHLSDITMVTVTKKLQRMTKRSAMGKPASTPFLIPKSSMKVRRMPSLL